MLDREKLVNQVQIDFKSVCRALGAKGFEIDYVDLIERHGFIVAKLDQGLARTIVFRIEPDPRYGAKKSAPVVRYTIGPCCPTVSGKDAHGYDVFMFNSSDRDRLIDQVVRDRDELRMRYGIGGYKMYVENNRAENAKKDTDVFWPRSKPFESRQTA